MDPLSFVQALALVVVLQTGDTYSEMLEVSMADCHGMQELAKTWKKDEAPEDDPFNWGKIGVDVNAEITVHCREHPDTKEA